MFEISEMVKRIQGSERSQRKSTVPKGAIRMDRGEPDFPTPLHIQEAATKAMRDNFTHYVDPHGDKELREAICLRLKGDYGVERNPEDVLISVGGIEAIHVISATYLNPGDEALVFDPGYSAYVDSIALFGGKPVFVPLTDRFHLDIQAIEDRISKRTKAIFLANPRNPTAAVLREQEIRGLAKVALEHDLLLIIDEVYHRLLYGGVEHFSICQVDEAKDRTILQNSFSKTYAMTGWRVGYLVADAKVIRDLVGLHKALVICVNAPAQKACVAALSGREMTNYLAERGIFVRSGTEFGENGQHHIRISFATSLENLEEGMERLKRALDELD